jgi:hypothetical protein
LRLWVFRDSRSKKRHRKRRLTLRKPYSGKSPYRGIRGVWAAGENRPVGVPPWRFLMLQWKPRLIALLVVLTALAVFLAQFSWDAVDQLSW